MVEIIPVDDKLKQQKYCHLLGSAFSLPLMAYVAISSGDPVGICQFDFQNDACQIHDISFDRSILKTRLPFMLLRAVLHYADECSIKSVYVYDKNCDENILISAGFTVCERGYYRISLQNFRH